MQQSTQFTRLGIQIILIALFISACGTKKHPYFSDAAVNWKNAQPVEGRKIVHTLYLIGDTGEMDDYETNTNYTVQGMVSQMDFGNENSSVVFLGDNVYPIGLVSESDTVKREIGEAILRAQLDPLDGFQGMTYMIPGNHDWNKDKQGGLEAINRQENFVEKHYGKNEKVRFYPKMGCGDPEVVKINKEVVYIFIDSQWWLQNWSDEQEINFGCDITSRGDFLQRMEELFLKYKNKEIICMLHHPIKSNGNHGGYFSLQQHLFPLAELGIWAPLPGLGSIYPIYRQATGSTQDNTHIKNQNLTKGIEGLAKKHKVNVVFASGHEHGLEYYATPNIKYIVSGSGSKTSYIQGGGEAEYARQARGYAKIDFYENFESWLEFYTVDGFGSKPVLEYRTQLRGPRAGTVEDEIKYPPIEQKDTTFIANSEFEAGPIKRFFLGEQYRDMWTSPITAEVIDLEEKYGGLMPIKKGGGMSSNSLRLQHESGKQYILRSIKKDYRKLVPEGFENLKLLDIMKDQNSASHPFGAMAVPRLSKAADIYYTEPKLVYLKHQRGLSNYNSLFPEELYLLEERPSGDWSDEAKFGNSEEIIGYTDLLKNLRKKEHHFIDQKWVLKSRMFDMWIHDWDRHDDQWRWAKFKNDENTIYRPIPRDRDQVFYKFVGFVPSLVSTFLIKKFKTMKANVKDVKNLAFNAQHFDRYFLNELEWSEWEEIISHLQVSLEDDIIAAALNDIPDQGGKFDNPEIVRKLKSRKKNLKKIGRRLYAFLSEEVEVLGSDNNDHFDIVFIDEGKIKITVYVYLENNERLKKFERTFIHTETNEVRIYGLRGEDTFVFSGTDNPKIEIKVIGGEDQDTLKNNSNYTGIEVYDFIEGIAVNGDVKDRTSKHYLVNEYDRNGFKYDTGIPFLKFGYTQDDGYWIGGGYNWTNFGWRKDPYKSKNAFSFSVAPGSQNAFQVNFNSDNVDAIGKLDLHFGANANFPRYENYFGLGNNSINTGREIQFNWVKLQTLEAILLAKVNTSSATQFTFGPVFQSQDINLTEGRVSEDPDLGFDEASLDRKYYGGIHLGHHLEFVDNKVFPSNGIGLDVTFRHLKELTDDENVTELDASFRSYIRLLAKPKLVLANELGYRKNWGDLEFHQYADLGNTTNLRGYRNNRFRGESALYHNVDLRMHLFDWDNNWLPMEIGILGGYDYGRVWLEGEESNKWHNSKTVGLWMNIMNLAVLQPHYTFVDEDQEDAFTLLVGFNF